MKKINIVQKEGEEPQPIEIMEKAILELSKGMKSLNASRLTRESIVTLLSWKSGVGKVEVRTMLDCMSEIESLFLKKNLK